MAYERPGPSCPRASPPPIGRRAGELADALQRSLEEGGASNLPPEEVARLWSDEIERRLARARERVARGEPTGRTAEEVFADAEAKIQSMRASPGR